MRRPPLAKLSKLWGDLLASLWFIPGLITMGAIALAIVLVEVDEQTDEVIQETWPSLFGTGPEGARSMLSAIATSLITVTGVAFSITIVTLSLASSQYSSRVLRTFLRDRLNQIVLGGLTGIFAYCLVVLRTIRSESGPSFAAPLAVSGAFLLSLVGVGLLIAFIHHIAVSIQASHLLAAIGAELIGVIDELFPDEQEDGCDAPVENDVLAESSGRKWHSVVARATGYIQRIDEAALLHFAVSHDTVVRMECGVGEFLIEGMSLASLCGNCEADDRITDELNAIYALSRERTVEQDPAFGIRQITDIANRALSPGVNDTTTALTSINYLTAVLVRLACRSLGSRHRDSGGKLRVIFCSPTFEDLVCQSFDPIRQNAAGNVAVLEELLRALEIIARATTSQRRLCLYEHAAATAEVVERTVASPRDRAILEAARLRLARLRDEMDGHRETKGAAWR